MLKRANKSLPAVVSAGTLKIEYMGVRLDRTLL